MLAYFRLLLLPFTPLYGFIVFLRNKMYDYGVLKSTKFDFPVICVGNLVVGGAGKTPVTEYLVRLLANYKVAILSRGYGRQTQGFILADEFATAQTIGDEPLQYYSKFKQVTVAVCEDRVKGIEMLRQTHEVILLDDAFQHRKLNAGFNILLFEFEKLKTPQFLLPAGNLREPFLGYQRANAIMVTKSPEQLQANEKATIAQKFDLKTDQDLFFSSINYGVLTPLFSGQLPVDFKDEDVFLLTGIANPKPLLHHLSKVCKVVAHLEYPDHHQFTLKNIQNLVNQFNHHAASKKIIVTTEKDSQRLIGEKFKDLLLFLPIYYLPIEITLATEDKFHFEKKILDYVTSNKRIG